MPRTSDVGAMAIPTGSYNVSITGVTTITLPTTAQRKPIVTGTTRTVQAGELMLIMSVETQNARITLDGSAPSATNGILIQNGSIFQLRGENAIRSLKIISVVAGGVINYGFTVDEAQ